MQNHNSLPVVREYHNNHFYDSPWHSNAWFKANVRGISPRSHFPEKCKSHLIFAFGQARLIVIEKRIWDLAGNVSAPNIGWSITEVREKDAPDVCRGGVLYFVSDSRAMNFHILKSVFVIQLIEAMKYLRISDDPTLFTHLTIIAPFCRLSHYKCRLSQPTMLEIKNVEWRANFAGGIGSMH